MVIKIWKDSATLQVRWEKRRNKRYFSFTFFGAGNYKYYLSCRCPAIGVPRPSIKFYKDGAPVPDRKTTKLDDFGSLVLTPASIENSASGVYTCVATNEAGSDTRNSTITLLGN